MKLHLPYAGRTPAKEVQGVARLKLIPCSYCVRKFNSVEAAAMHEKAAHKKARRKHTALFRGEPIEDMETAKRVIAKFPKVDIDQLMTIAADQTQPLSARVTAVYTLGMTDDRGVSTQLLLHLCRSAAEPDEIRDHAAEALETIHDL